MARGGFRPGAGRPKGSGSKPKLVAKKAARASSKLRAEAPANQTTEPRTRRDPLAYMLDVLNDLGATVERRDRRRSRRRRSSMESG